MKNFILLFFTAISLLYFSCASQQVKTSQHVQYAYPGDRAMWAQIFSLSKPYVLPEGEGAFPRAVIIPHHDITALRQNSFYSALSAKVQPKVVVVLCPDHFESGKSFITLPGKTVFETPDGELSLYKEFADELKKSELGKYVCVQDEIWRNEHGIFTHTPFIAHYFAGTKFLPVLLKPESCAENAQLYKRLGEFLCKVLPKESLVVASVDFSHYQIPRMTAMHDYVSMNTIANWEDVTNLEVDSPESLTAVTAFAASCGCTMPLLVDRSSTYDYVPDDDVVSTSHQYWAFYPGLGRSCLDAFAKKALLCGQKVNCLRYGEGKNCTVLFAGSGSLGAGVRTFWAWDRYGLEKDEALRSLRDAAGTEARFFKGFDAYVFDPAVKGEPYLALGRVVHGTCLGVWVCPLEKMGLAAGLCASGIAASVSGTAASGAYAEKKGKLPCVNILVLQSGAGGKAVANGKGLTAGVKASAKKLLSEYDCVIVRSTDDSFGAWAFVRGKGSGSKNTVVEEELGFLCLKDGALGRGAFLAVNWQDGFLQRESFSYQLNDCGLPPRVFQGQGEDEPPKKSVWGFDR
ncbi:MAG: AmmeMemoRadiSam system protein B [Treponema sp.]|nr:AmmeMemoRadiSam system protein B [Treponema sp.]